ncbi:hypothetical protein [Paracoccus seriniphilus]|uniref:Uncharacterized protein n=1 Tax=Paracoccus seriniphilus TaxID=184748 RepID=A0A239PPM8_9RHOB|nr:hypothetical protein [Paracoccus seriniphilus]WCR14903.1 hypothetical protein JHW44_05555 [Paracoccus seriniphilus]SNT71677.1 hypothetical protein SAMN05444959_102191 [Paracoccus seriniphilus]
MPRNTFLALLSLPLALTACGTPQERCISRHTSEYRAVSKLLDEVEANLERGYAWGERAVESDRLTQCRRVHRAKDGSIRVAYRPCYVESVDIQRYRIPIDPATETRKRDNLRERQKELAAKAQASVQACKAAYPE